MEPGWETAAGARMAVWQSGRKDIGQSVRRTCQGHMACYGWSQKVPHFRVLCRTLKQEQTPRASCQPGLLGRVKEGKGRSGVWSVS